MNRRKYIIKSRLKSDYYWTDRLIEKYLKTPDLISGNPNHPRDPFARPCQYYLKNRVGLIQMTKEFQRDFQRRMKRRRLTTI